MKEFGPIQKTDRIIYKLNSDQIDLLPAMADERQKIDNLKLQFKEAAEIVGRSHEDNKDYSSVTIIGKKLERAIKKFDALRTLFWEEVFNSSELCETAIYRNKVLNIKRNQYDDLVVVENTPDDYIDQIFDELE